MTYISAEKIEELAGDLTRRHGLKPGFDLELLLDELGLDLLWEEIPEENGERILGQITPEERRVTLNELHQSELEEKQGTLRRFTIGHEIGHWTLHCEAIRAGAHRRPGADGRLCQAAPQRAIEKQADIFSAALLIPEGQLEESLPLQRWSGWNQVYELASAFVVNVTPMRSRLEELGFIRLDHKGVPYSHRLPSMDQDPLFA